MKSPQQLTERFYLGIVLRIAGGVLLFGLLLWGGLHAFHKWQERHLLRRAAGFLAGGDVRTAALNARRVSQLNPDNVDAARMLAQLAQRVGDRSEIDWRRKVLELRPDSIDDALALVRATLRAGDIATAERTLAAIAPRAQNTAAYHAALGRIAEMRKNRAEAETDWRKAAELAPNDPGYQTQVAMSQLSSEDEREREAGRATLERLRADPQHRVAATRALIMDGASRPSDAQRLRKLAEELQSYPEAAFSDRLLYAEILRQLRDPGLNDYLAQLQQRAGGNPTDLATLLSWMAANGKAAEAVKFAVSLPPATVAKMPVPLALAEAYSKSDDWSGLRTLAERADWSAFNFARHAYLARALRAEDDQVTAEQEWAQAQKDASADPQHLLALAHTVGGWGWEKERVTLLWEASKARETRVDALQELYSGYAQSGDTAGLYRVLLRSIEVAPEDPTMQNNFAQISLLLDADPDRARKIAAELVHKDPKNPSYVSTYAFSLYTGGDVEGAVQAFSGLAEDQLQKPAIAAYYGIVLAAAGEKEKARAYLERGAKAFLLPQERALVEKAQASVQ